MECIFPWIDSRSYKENGPPIVMNPSTLSQCLRPGYGSAAAIYVVSMKYCKQPKKPYHEFLIIEVESNEVAPNTNVLRLDRTSSEPLANASQHVARAIGTQVVQSCPRIVSSHADFANDTFAISNNRSKENLLQDRQLRDHHVIEDLRFRKPSFPLYELAVIASTVSIKHPTYNAMQSQCYFYASLIWECVVNLLPNSAYQCHSSHNNDLIRTKYGGHTFSQKIDQDDVDDILATVERDYNIFIRKQSEITPNDCLLRNRNIFPGGFDLENRTRRGALQFTLPQLESYIVGGDSSWDNIDGVYITRIEYCKEKKMPQHEFIVITVQDKDDLRLQNFLILDRRQEEDRSSNVLSSSSLSGAIDLLRVSYNGDLQQLVEDCAISKYRILETMTFPSMRFFLYELVTLARTASEYRRRYSIILNQSHWYASLVWDCARIVFSKETYEKHWKSDLRGRFGKLTATNIDGVELSFLSEAVHHQITIIRNALRSS
ncbi:Vegetative incompatibility protein HET-E-1 [Ceratobasidium sp. AG-Ba]|nr:Vegetative incompatibility protein HET-E-1 [Ceratobasidium sp. AG-Ba]